MEPDADGQRSHVERLYADAFASAERGKRLEQQQQDPLDAADAFQHAIRILSRLAIVESAAKRALVRDAVRGLQDRVRKLEQTRAFLLAKAMQIHEQAKQTELQQQQLPASDQAIQLYVSAGDWYEYMNKAPFFFCCDHGGTT